MKLSALLQPLIDAKVPHEIIMQQILAFEAMAGSADEARKEKGRERWHRWKEKKSTNVSQRLPTAANNSRGGATRVEDKTSNLEIEPQKEEKKDAPARDLSDFKAEFQDLDAERLTALIKHRRSKHGQVTGHAARLFRKAAMDCGLSISQAVDTCIDRNWITLKPDWLNKPQARGSPPQKPETTTDAANRLLAQIGAQNGQPSTSSERHHQALVAIPGGKHAGFGG